MTELFETLRRVHLLAALAIATILFSACDPSRRTAGPAPNRPSRPTVPGKNEPMDTVRWAPNTNKPPIKNEPGSGSDRPGAGDTYHIGFLLPFLTSQATAGTVPEKSRLGLQFYAGAKIALEQVSQEEKINLVVDVWDTQGSDAEFQALLNTNSRIQKPSVFIGPVRSSHVVLFSDWAKSRRKIMLSPESPNAEPENPNPDFIQLNPSLKTHCEVIAKHACQTSRPEAITLVCRKKEADRLSNFQNAGKSLGYTTTFAELVMPDEAINFDKVDLRKYLKAGKVSVFILPSWSSQDFVMGFLRKLKEVKGANQVRVYGMPQWRGFEGIEPEYFTSLNVHISAASWIDYSSQEVRNFQQKFYEATGTIPDEDAFNGYDVTLFTARMLVKYGLSFPQKLKSVQYGGLHGKFGFSGVFQSGLDGSSDTPDFWENKQLHILQYGKSGFAPVRQ